MTRNFTVLLLLAALTLPAAGQDAARKFPIGKTFRVLSISGFDVQKAGITLTIKAEPQSNRLMGSGHAGCNSWSATVMLREGQIDFTNIVSAKKFCGKPRMTSEEAFLTTLKSAERWRLDDKNRMILEGMAARLLLTAGGSGKQTETKSDKKPAQASANQRPVRS